MRQRFKGRICYGQVLLEHTPMLSERGTMQCCMCRQLCMLYSSSCGQRLLAHARHCMASGAALMCFWLWCVV
jgi:hypothetical protein